jgi:hypothetical protein
MSVINVIKQSKQLHVLTDGAVYVGEEILHSACKVWTAAHLPAIFAARGPRWFCTQVVDRLAFGADTFGQLKDEIADRFRVAMQELTPALALVSAHQPTGINFDKLEVVVAGMAGTSFDCFFICNHSELGAEAFALQSMGDLAFLPGTEKVELDFIAGLPPHASANDIDPVTDGARLMDLQRQANLAPIGGFAQLTSMDTSGAISTRIIKRWSSVECPRVITRRDNREKARSRKADAELDCVWDEADRSFAGGQRQ